MESRDSQWERLPAVAVQERCKPLVPEQGCSQSMCMSQEWVCVWGGWHWEARRQVTFLQW